ncbi:nuclear protein MDM1 isoform X2 [Anabas testudineus]|uniref:nuclear protein MDM1 isoform X2 n=1 Tax=Anabas testudineus TaxID=64144 RepID=UPI000E45C6C3|nr:nuclear protein MDM1 isoform X2 [Anabas testudineus]
MTVRFKCQSEYQKSYGVSRSRSVSPQRCAPLAGLRSDHIGISREPGLQRRKRLGPGPVTQSSTCLLRPSDLQAESTAHAHRTGPSAAPRSHRKEPPLDPKPSTPPELGSTSEPETPAGPRPVADPGAPAESKTAADSGLPAEPAATRKFAKPHSSQPQSHPLTAAPDGQHSLADKGEHALRWRSGFRGRRSGGQRSEYHRQFHWKKPLTAASPILTAEQLLYPRSRSIPPFKKNPLPMETEYRQSFQGLVPPSGPRLRKHLEHQRVPLFHTYKTKRTRKEESKKKPQRDGARPQSPPPPAQVQRRHRIPEEGEATDGDTPQVKELREKALSYRRRAWGTNFSRDHLSQLQSEHNALWEPTDTIDSPTDPPSPRLTIDLCQDLDSHSTSCVEALDLASRSCNSSKRSSLVGSAEILRTNKNTANSPQIKAQSPSSAAERRTAWGDEEEEEEEENTDEEDGRLPTPRLKTRPVQRTHHDLTTPATGGAILVGKLKSSDESSPYKPQRSGSTVSMAAGVDTTAEMPIKLREVWSDDNHTHLKSSGPSPDHKQASKQIKTRKKTPPSPVAQPSMASSPLHCIQGTLRHPEFQHNGELGSRFRELQCSGGGCGSDEDDRLSVMSWRSAASCSMASAVLERAQMRRENFWGKR